MYLKGNSSQLYATAQNLLRDSLFINAVYQMLGTSVLAGFGFLFWLLCAKLVSTEVIGLATTLISIANLLAILSLIGFDTALVRFLSHSSMRSEKINTSMLLVGGAAGTLSALFVFAVPVISPQLAFIQANPLFVLLFIVFCVTFALNLVTGAIFLAYRQTQFSLISNTLFSMIKISLPFLFVPWGAFGIFTAAALAQTIGLVLSIAILIKKFDYRPQLVINRAVIARVWHYSLNNYIAGVLNLLPLSLLPIIITNNLGPASAAYFYIIMMIGSLLYIIPSATSRSLLAEGSHNEKDLPALVERSVRTMVLFLMPAILVLFLGGKYILEIFGASYASETSFLYMVVLSGIAVGAYSLFCSLLRIRHDGRALIAVNIIYAASILGFSYLLMPLGLFGIGLAWLSGNTVASLSSFLVYLFVEYKGPTLAEKWSDFRLLILSSKLQYLSARLHNREHKTILCYPEKPAFFHTLYMVCHRLGYSVSTDPSAPFDAAIVFEDTTHRSYYPALEGIPRHKLINSGCNDISKVHVDAVFTEVFGYSSFVDPTEHIGVCVKKSNVNAVHDGEIIACPATPEDGYIYQKLIDNQVNAQFVVDIRVPFFKGTIPFCTLRYKSIDDRFDYTQKAVLSGIAKHLSTQELANLCRFCEKFQLEYGELDLLRDKDGTLYIVDVNTTPAGPRIGPCISKEDFGRFISGLSNAFESTFVQRAA